MKDKIEIGKLIQESRKKKGYTQKELAEKLNVSNKAISHWETGRYYPDYEYFNDIAKVLDINLNEYLKKEDNNIKKYIKTTITIISIILLIFLSMYFINNYNKFALYEVNLDNNKISIKDSYITKTKEYVIINLGKIDNKEYLLQPTYKLTLYHNNNILTTIKNYNGLTYKSIEKEVIKNINNLSIKLEYQYFDKEKQTKTINFKLNQIDSNRKLINKQKKFEKTNENQINLLLNNDYYKINDKEYQKIQNNTTYTYNINTKTLIYEENEDDLKIIAEYKDDLKRYLVVKKDKIIEEYTHNQNRDDSYWLMEIYNKTSEENQKITIEKFDI